MKNYSIRSLGMKAALAGLVIILNLHSEDCMAQWATNSYINTPVCILPNPQGGPVIAPDGSGGAIIVWIDQRASLDIYAQRLDANGIAKWTTNGIPICTAAYFRAQPAIIPDGNGGAIITWADFRNGNDFDIYAQHVDGNGVIQWATDGVAICTSAGDQTYPVLASDANGGAFLTWNDNKHFVGGNYDIFIQGININGTLKWPSELGISTNGEDQLDPTIISDGNGGAIVAWKDTRNQYVNTSVTDIFAQRINSAGLIQWTPDGASICEAYRFQGNQVLVSDGNGGAIIAWVDERNLDDIHPTNSDIYAQYISANGVVQWTVGGIGICTTISKELNVAITSDQAGGAIITWQSWGGYANDVLVQRVNGSGVAQWAGNGVPIGAGAKESPIIISDGNGGAIIAWIDTRSGAADIYAQHIGSDGLELWRPFGGIVVSNAYGTQSRPHLTTDNNGGTIITWEDYRNTDIDVFAQRVQNDGTLGSVITRNEQIFVNKPVVSVFPNPVENDLYLDLSSIDSKSPVNVSLLDQYGRTLKTISGNGVMQLSLENYKPSPYILNIKYEGHEINKKIIKR